MTPPPEYAFVASEAARPRARRAVAALNALGYDARAYDPADWGEGRRAKAIVFLDTAPQAERFVFDYRDRPVEGCEKAQVVTAAAEHAAAARAALAREVEVVPDPCEGARGAPRAARVKPRSRPLEWLARKAGLATDSWRTKLLWSGGIPECEAIVGAYPGLKMLGREVALELHCVAAPEVLDALLERVQEDAPDAVRLSFEAATPQGLARSLEACDFVLLPAPGLRRAAVHAGRFAILGDDPCEAIRRALARPGETLEHLQHAQHELDQTHASALAARAWVGIFMKGLR